MHARQGIDVLVDVGILRTRQEFQLAARQLQIDLLDGNAAGNETQPEKVGERRVIGRKQRRECALIWTSDIVARSERPRYQADAQRIVAQRVVETVHERGIRPFEAEADQLDPVAPFGAGCPPGFRLQETDRLVAAVRLQNVVASAGAGGQLVGTVVGSQIGCHEDCGSNSEDRPAPFHPVRGDGQERRGSDQPPIALNVGLHANDSLLTLMAIASPVSTVRPMRPISTSRRRALTGGSAPVTQRCTR